MLLFSLAKRENKHVKKITCISCCRGALPPTVSVYVQGDGMKRYIFRDGLILAVVALSFLGFLLYTEPVHIAVGEALRLCAGSLIPSLFPTMVVSSFLVESGVSRGLGRAFDRGMRFLFRVPGTCIVSFLPGLVAGYPVGAKTALALYESGQCSRGEAERLLAFANNAGPAFLLGAVGVGMYSSLRLGAILYLFHVLSALMVGFLFRFWKGKEVPMPTFPPGEERGSLAAAFTKSVRDSAVSSLHITAFVTFFSAVSCVLSESGFLPGLGEWLGFPVPFLAGVLEMSGGVAGLIEQGGEIAMVAFLVGWAGFSVHFQVMSFVGEKRISLVPYFVGKLLQGGMTAGLAGLFMGN